MTGIDATHDPALRCWVPGADGHPEFPIQNLPLGVFSPPGGGARGGVAIGDWILDLAGLAASGVVAAEAKAPLNGVLALGAAPRRALRSALSQALADPRAAAQVRPHLYPASDCTLHLPCAIGDYTDFYAGIHHATAVGRLLRPDQPLPPNYKHVPIGYHGRASSVRASGTPVRRPNGQTRPQDAPVPRFGPSRRLDFELELGIWVGPGNAPGEKVPIGQAPEHIAGYCLLNDWSARDIQGWEYQPLGPFLAKNFATTISCWIVTPEALAPFRLAQPPRPRDDPAPLAYLWDDADQAEGALDIALAVTLTTPDLRARGLPPHRLARSHARHLYWTPAQLLAHHTSGGCDLRPGDLLGTGTISGPDPDGCGSMLEATRGGREPIVLATGEERRFLEDGDEIGLHAYASREGFATIGFGACRGRITPAP
jgi:fumarylacetoacetase